MFYVGEHFNNTYAVQKILSMQEGMVFPSAQKDFVLLVLKNHKMWYHINIPPLFEGWFLTNYFWVLKNRKEYIVEKILPLK